MNGLNNAVMNNNDPTTFRCLLPPVLNGTFIQWARDGIILEGGIGNELTVDSETGVYCCMVDGITARCAYIYLRST